MAYDTYEDSVEGSQPVEIYRIILGPDSYRYTSAEDDVVIDGNTYIAIPISRNKIGRGQEERKNMLTLTVPGNNEIAIQYISNVPGQRGHVIVQRYQRPDGVTPEVITLYEGLIASVSFENDATVAKIAVQPISQATSREIPRFVYSAQCNHVLYDSGCKILNTNPLYKHSGTITVVSGNTITVPGLSGFAANWFKAGYVEALAGLDSRPIINHSGDVLQLLLPFPFNGVGKSVDVYAGCPHTIATCKSKFDNVINFGGFAFVPTKNIFETGLL
jgi:uncharacterized phage protein (TIGR02218 family)